jgi:Fur family ferric uptake transcriptional regulator
MLDKFHAILRQHGHSVTTSRTLLFEYLVAHEAVPIRQFVEDNRKIADQASMYRSIRLFRELGVIEERFAGNQKLIELSDIYDRHHHHLTCTNCGVVIPVAEDQLLEQRIAAIVAGAHFKQSSHQLEINGLCAACQQL